ncbi:hypothetical protein IGI04_040438 [Brassica rapa subsp. trilocularis]|uniref:Uncharacterized protein n=1 Tax=Brassica rapa subsp. trilocularis TaxID=1813537 RepID=A0ABQ7KNM7_BRACM|nr:hypothetical protein IGI04_040438 [Brassica rapa subsp. trilocularis]
MIGSILRTSERPSRNIERVISGHLRSRVSQKWYQSMIVMGSYPTVIFHSRSTETSLNGWTVFTDVTVTRLEFATLMVGLTTVMLGRDIWDIGYISNTSPNSCVIEVKVGVDCDLIQCDSTAHEHSDALILPASQVYPAYAKTYKHQSHTSLISLTLVSSLALEEEVV